MEHRRYCIALVATLLALPGPVVAFNGTIFIGFEWSSPWDGTLAPCREIGCGQTANLYVYAQLAGATAGGINGAEYKIAIGPNNNADPGWLFSETFSPGAVTIGSGALTPVDPSSRGVTLAWPECQEPCQGMVFIQRATVLNTSCPGAPTRLQVVKRDSPSNQFFQCPLFVLCDGPVYTKVCAGFQVVTCPNPEPPFPNNAMCSVGGIARLNSPTNPDCFQSIAQGCLPPIAVQPISWTQVKELYRN